jgi:hypothetical protein
MEIPERMELSLDLEERKHLLETVLSMLARCNVEVFLARDPAVSTFFTQRQKVMEAILKRLSSVQHSGPIASSGADGSCAEKTDENAA